LLIIQEIDHPMALRSLLQALTWPAALALAATHPVASAAEVDIPTITVIGSRQQQSRIAGSATVIDAEAIQTARAFNVNEVLRKAPGLFPREEEGFGLRPNIGIRGLNPTRSSKVLLLEDGLPLAYSPYGDNASYYHPAIERFSSLEVLKGSAQIAFGPHTVGGVVNYLTPNPAEQLSATVRAAAGNAGYRQLYGEVSNSAGRAERRTGVLLQGVHKRSEGALDNTAFEVGDINLKLVQQLGERQALTLKLSRYQENSQVPYSGLTLAEYRSNPRSNPFVNDTLTTRRDGQSLVHHLELGPTLRLDTALYRSEFHRDWWRQSSNSGQRPNDASDPRCGGMTNLLSTCGNEGRLRDYVVLGLEPRLQFDHGLGTLRAGLRLQREQQRRLQVNADTPQGRSPGSSVNGGLVENNDRATSAFAWFVEQSVELGRLTLTPGLRHEDIDYARYNRLNGARGSTTLQETLAGLGANWRFDDGLVLFAGLHEGFSPPRVEDIISNSSGASVELAAEKSLNSELGLRYRNGSQVSLEAALFRMDFANQIVPASVAGGLGATLTSAGETLHAGAELLVDWQYDRDFARSRVNPYLNLSWTWVRDARYLGERRSVLDPSVNVTGNRLPYTPEHTLSLTAGLALLGGLRAQLELFQVDAMVTDDLNSLAITANGQRGRLPGYRLYNLSLNYRVPDRGLTLFLAGKNLGAARYAVDASRGLLPGMQRTWQAGLEWQF
jgi:Fe(3+) dicitrate transport protein